MYVLIRIDGMTEPEFSVRLLGLYETVDEARESMEKDVSGREWRIVRRDAVSDTCDVHRYFMGAHIFLQQCFWQWIIFDADRPLEWSSLLSW